MAREARAAPSNRDLLGLAAAAYDNTDRLLHGFNVFTSRARYYSFLCYAIQRAVEHRSDRAAPAEREDVMLELSP